ncbi:MAG: type IV pilus assembly protein PilM [Elusimicrobia bacterium]|nr:type IV pilus assembly protein PilM [Elusimicrobiota bacterium]
MGKKEEIIAKITGLGQKVIGFFEPKETLLAVDIGSHGIKLARLKKGEANAKKPTLELLRYIEINQQDLPLDEEAKKAFLTRLLRLDFAGAKIKEPLTAVSVSGSSVIVREVKLPALPHKELRAALSVEAEPYLPFDVQEVHLDYHVTGEVTEKGEKKYTALLIAAKKDFVEGRLGLLAGVKAKPVVVEVDSLALANIMTLKPESLQSAFVLCSIGATVSNLAIIDKGTPRLARDIAVGGGIFTRAVQKETGLAPAEAENLKREMGLVFEEDKLQALGAEGDPKKLQAAKAMLQVATDLMNEVNKSMTFYLTHGVESKIQKIYLAGGGALLKNLDAFASKHLKLPVEIFNPLELFNLPAGHAVNPALGPMFGVVCGLALRKWNDWARR